MTDNNVKKETLTFYRRMANTNITIMKKYKSAHVNKMKLKEIQNMYSENNINFDEDVKRLHEKKNISISDPVDILTETSECNSEPCEVIQESCEKNNLINIIPHEPNKIDDVIYTIQQYIPNNVKTFIENNSYLPIIIPILISSILYVRRK